MYPSPQRIASAARFINGRSGHTAFAVVDTRGQLAGVRIHDRFHSASTVKAMLLTAYLQNLAGAHRGLDSSSRALLYPMIHVSDNNAASAVFASVGESGLSRVAHEVGMTDFSTSGWWGFTMVSAADQARFFYIQDRLIPRQFDGYARGLESPLRDLRRSELGHSRGRSARVPGLLQGRLAAQRGARQPIRTAGAAPESPSRCRS